MTSSTPTATYTYEWTDAEQTSLKRTDAEGNIAIVPIDPGNRDYAQFIADAAVATAYVEPPAVVDSRTDTQKLEDATGLTCEQIKTVLGISY
jgi:hypothetical protein